MGLETGNFLDDLVASNPVGTDDRNQGDDHIRLIKSLLKATFIGATRAFHFPAAPNVKEGAYTVVLTDQNSLIRGDVSSGDFTITLPLGSTVFAGYEVSIMKSDSSSNTLTVDGNGGETINGATTDTLTTQYKTVTYRWDGSEWKKVSMFEPAGDEQAGIGKQSIYIPANAMTKRSANGALPGTTTYGTTNRTDIPTLAFDKDSNEYAQFNIIMPKSWDAGVITFQPYWSSTVTSGTVDWYLQGKSLSDGDAIDSAFGTAVTSGDEAAGTAGDLLISPVSNDITISNAAKEEQVFYQIYRDTGDTMAADALLHGIMLHYTTDATTDD